MKDLKSIAEKKLGRDTVKEMEAMDQDNLKRVIVEANTAMKQVQDELDANEKYQELKESLSALTQGKREINTRQKARIALALLLLSNEVCDGMKKGVYR